MASEFRIEGECDKRFENARKAFAENFEKRGELGAAVSIVIDGRPVVDLWGGYADKTKTRPWQRDTLVNVYSTTKGLTADLCPSADRSGQARSRRAGVEVLAGVRAGREEGSSRAIHPEPSRGITRGHQAADRR